MSGDPIALFPPYGIDQTIHVSILIGVLLLLLLTESFGWVFNGLVVPGYLASLFVIAPAAGTTVVAEAVVTYLAARLLSTVAARSGAWNIFFGRERFLLLVFVSIMVRQTSELWLVPEALRFYDDQTGAAVRVTKSFSSVGLVLVPLTANAFWKLGLRRGMFQTAVPTAITWALLTYVLLPYTNLSFARLEITYENVALDFLSSPKAYILLVTGAYLGSRWNLLYGWDYAGILVPALLGLAWLSPMRLVTTLAETLLLVVVVRGLLWVPGLRTLNLEGPRKLALVFVVSFWIKYALGWIVGPSISELRITDLFGFGYLLSSLLAVKILQKDNVVRIALPTFVVSVITIAIGSLIGFSLDQVAPAPAQVVVPPPPPATASATTTLVRTSEGVVALGHVRARLGVASELPLEPTAQQLASYRRTWAAIDEWLTAPSPATKQRAATEASALGLTLTPIARIADRDAWALFEREERLVANVGWDTAVLIPGAPGPVLTAPWPSSDSPSAEAAAALCPRVACRAIVVSGIDVPGERRVRSAHAIAVDSVARAPIVELRVDDTLERGRPVLHVATETPQVDVAALWPASLELSWRPVPGTAPRGTASVLRAHPDAYWQRIANEPPTVERATSIERWFTRFFEQGAEDLARDPNAPQIVATAPSQSELRFLELLVARPALLGDLRAAHAMAQVVGMGVVQLPDGRGRDRAAWVIAEQTLPRRLGWGVLAGRPSVATAITNGLAVEVPRPRREPGTGRIAVELWHQLDALALIVADGAVPEDRADADPAATWNPYSAFQAFHQAAHDRLRNSLGSAMISVRGFGVTQPIRDQVVVALAQPLLDRERLPPPIARVLKEDRGVASLAPHRINDGARELVDLAGTGNPQLQYCARFDLVACALVWFSDSARERYHEVPRDRELAKITRMGLAATDRTAAEELAVPELAVADPTRERVLRDRFAPIATLMDAYARSGNVQLLRSIAGHAAASRGALTVTGGYSDELGRPFLAARLRDGDHELRAVSLTPAGVARLELPPGSGAVDRAGGLLAQRPLSVVILGRAAGGP